MGIVEYIRLLILGPEGILPGRRYLGTSKQKVDSTKSIYPSFAFNKNCELNNN